MAENGSELRKIAWSQAFPFVRLFHTLRLSLGINRLILAWLCIILCYIGGRILDGICSSRHGVVAMSREGATRNEIEVYATSKFGEFRSWLTEARQAPEQRAIEALLMTGGAKNADTARQKLASDSLRKLLADAARERGQPGTKALAKLVDQRLKAGLAALDKDTKLAKAEREQQERTLREAADTARMMLRGQLPRGTTVAQGEHALEVVAAADPQVEPQKWGDDLTKLKWEAIFASQLRQYDELQPRGPFISLLKFEMHCFAAAIQGACGGRWGFSGHAFAAQPSMCGSIESAVRGVSWLVNQHGWYTLFFVLYNLLIFAYFGGAVCRSAAVQSARDESISIGESLKFVRERFGGFILAPLLPAGVFIGIAVLMFIGGLIGVIPYLGELLTGVFYPLALLGGFALAILVLATVLGFHLMWPTVAVEGSDGFDALSRACSYVGSRIWHVGFYSFVLLLYGGVSFVILRVLMVVMLKLSHKFTGLGMNLVSSANSSDIGKLNAIWSMPAWSDLSLLPGTGDAAPWGKFAGAPLDGAETLGMWFISLWVMLVVGLLAAFVVSFFFCGSTQMYFLLRRDVDATDYDEVYYEETEEELPMSETPVPPADQPPPATEAPATGSGPSPTDAGPPPGEQPPPAQS